MGRTKITYQFDLFNQPTYPELAWALFMPDVAKLHEERRKRKNTTGGYASEIWWRSRYYEFVTNNNSKPKDNADWLRRKALEAAWPWIWKAHEKDMSNVKMDPI